MLKETLARSAVAHKDSLKLRKEINSTIDYTNSKEQEVADTAARRNSKKQFEFKLFNISDLKREPKKCWTCEKGFDCMIHPKKNLNKSGKKDKVRKKTHKKEGEESSGAEMGNA